MENYLSERAPEFLIHNLLELNTNKKKEKVIQTKIARYFFIGDFDLSPFLNMNVPLLSRVLALIEGEPTNVLLSSGC